MKTLTAAVLLVLYPAPAVSQEQTDPTDWSRPALERVEQFADSIGTAALLIISNGDVVASYGRIDHPFRAHSIRKSLLSALVGIAVHEGALDTTQTLSDLNIDDRRHLSVVERSATVMHLLEARSGVYHPAASETDEMREARPNRGSHAPGTHWYYNNWDFNTLGTIYTQVTGLQIGDAFQARIAGPIGFEDFDLAEHFQYQLEEERSQHPSYKFRLSARDLARFGVLFADDGRWNGKQIVPASWVERSTAPRSSTDQSGTKSAYGLMWWATGENRLGLPTGSFTASGSGGQRMTVLPRTKTVIVHLMDTDDRGGPRIGTRTYNQLVRLVLDAQPGEPQPNG